MRSPRWARNYRCKCHCGGYWFPHRKGSGACDHSKTRDYHRAARANASDAAVEFVSLFLSGHIPKQKHQGVPF